MRVPSHAGCPDAPEPLGSLATNGPVRLLHTGVGAARPVPSRGAAARGRAGAARPSAERTMANDRGNAAMSPTGPKYSRAASCFDSRISRFDAVGASIRLVSHAMSKSSPIVWREKYSPMAVSMARSSSSDAVAGE
jgi:hypothetical protein